MSHTVKNMIVVEYDEQSKASELLQCLRQLHNSRQLFGKYALVLTDPQGQLRRVEAQGVLSPPFEVRRMAISTILNGATIVLGSELFPVIKDFFFGVLTDWMQQLGIYLLFPIAVGISSGMGAQVVDYIRRFIGWTFFHNESAGAMPKGWGFWHRLYVGALAGGVVAALYVVYHVVKLLVIGSIFSSLPSFWGWLLGCATTGFLLGLLLAGASELGTWLGFWQRARFAFQYQDVIHEARLFAPNTATLMVAVTFRGPEAVESIQPLIQQGHLVEQNLPSEVAAKLFTSSPSQTDAVSRVPSLVGHVTSEGTMADTESV